MRINVEYSTQHWIFPIITIGILVILGVLLIALEGRARIKAGKGFFVKPGRFFVEHYDKFKFWGTIALMVVYFFLLDKLGFTFWSIICLFLFNTLFANKAQLKNPRYHITSLIIRNCIQCKGAAARRNGNTFQRGDCQFRRVERAKNVCFGQLNDGFVVTDYTAISEETVYTASSPAFCTYRSPVTGFSVPKAKVFVSPAAVTVTVTAGSARP